MLRDFINEIKEEESIPEILGERCVHNHLEQASCRACVDACPKQAWVLDDEQLGIDVEACDNCGLCAPVCPEGAIQHDHAPVIGKWKQRIIGMSACEKAGVKAFSEAVMPCVHTLGMHNLLTLYKQGCHSFFLATGECDRCERGNNQRLADHIRTTNKLLGSRGLPLVKSYDVSLRQWRSLADRLAAVESEPAISRRHFFRNAMMNLTDHGLQIAGLRETEDDEYIAVGKLLPASLEQDVSPNFPYAPLIDASLCIGCDACTRACPHQAVALGADEAGGPAYQFEAAACTGCHICIDVCPPGAVSIALNTPQLVERMSLESYTCVSCGVNYHQPVMDKKAPSTKNMCHICSKVQPNRNLFQVYD